MMRVCHKNTCPVGIATQNLELRKKFKGGADAVVNFMNFIAEEMREVMAQFGFRTIEEMVGRVDKLEMRAGIDHWKAKGLDYSKILYRPDVGPEVGTYCTQDQDHLLDRSLDVTEILEKAQPAINDGTPVEIDLPIINTNRVVGTITGAEISRKHGAAGLAEDTLKINIHGSAGQSLGAFCPKGMTFTVTGDTNDYLGKGLSGAKIVVRPDPESLFVAHENIITGNVCFYGATQGEAYIAGMAGERFCVRNSGVEAVVEGLGDHALEYMTGGMVINLGSTGRNLGAGMSGGVAYIYDEAGDFVKNSLNPDMVNVYQLIECEDEEIALVKGKIEKHVALSGSVRGQSILDGWPDTAGKILKVLPQDYERVLQAVKRAEAAGLAGDEAIQAAFEENVAAGH
jgi:glutamate synthase (ferredoxin)